MSWVYGYGGAWLLGGGLLVAGLFVPANGPWRWLLQILPLGLIAFGFGGLACTLSAVSAPFGLGCATAAFVALTGVGAALLRPAAQAEGEAPQQS